MGGVVKAIVKPFMPSAPAMPAIPEPQPLPEAPKYDDTAREEEETMSMWQSAPYRPL